MCQYFSNTQGQCSQAMKEADMEAFENNIHHHGTMKTIAKAYTSNRAVLFSRYFVNINLPEERNQVLHPESELSELPDDSLNVFKRSKIDHYMQRPVEHPILENTIF